MGLTSLGDELCHSAAERARLICKAIPTRALSLLHSTARRNPDLARRDQRYAHLMTSGLDLSARLHVQPHICCVTHMLQLLRYSAILRLTPSQLP
jgi:hypothetical protein